MTDKNEVSRLSKAVERLTQKLDEQDSISAIARRFFVGKGLAIVSILLIVLVLYAGFYYKLQKPVQDKFDSV